MSSEFGRLMRYHRGPRTTAEAAAAAGVTPRTIGKVEAGDAPSCRTFAALVRFYNADPRTPPLTEAQEVELLRAVVALGGAE